LLFLERIRMNYTGLVVYCDGGTFRKNPGSYGRGLHWYTYDTNTIQRKFPIGNINPTTKGYATKDIPTETFPAFDSKEAFIEAVKSDKTYLVNVTSIKEHAQGYPDIQSNNAAELQAMVRAFEVVLETKADITLIYSDSQYVLRAIGSLDKLNKFQFCNPNTGTPLSNQHILKELYRLQILINEANLKYMAKWIKGHGDAKNDDRTQSSIPNLFADEMASIAASLSNNLFYLSEDNDRHEREITFDDLANERKPKKIHPFLNNKRMYLGFTPRKNKEIFFVGNPGDINQDKKIERQIVIDSKTKEEIVIKRKVNVPIDIYTGKMIADAQVGVVVVEGGDPIVNLIEEVQEKWIMQHYAHPEMMYCLYMNTVSDSKTYANLLKHKELWISRSFGTPNLETVDGKVLTYINDPVYLAIRNFDNFEQLYLQLEYYRSKHIAIREMDITELLYDTHECSVNKDFRGDQKEKAILGKSLKKEIGSDFKSLTLEAEFGEENTVKRKIILTTGVDLLSRNQLKSIETENPSVKLLSWHHSGNLYSFAVFIETHKKTENGLQTKDYGIWRGVYSSQILIE